MIATLLLLLVLPYGSPADAPPPAWEAQAAPGLFADAPPPEVVANLGSSLTSPAIAASHLYFPFIVRPPYGCEPIPGVEYGTLDVNGPPTDRPAEHHADLNLSMRGYETTNAYLGLVDYSGGADAKAPQLYTLFADQRVPSFPNMYQVYDWNWECNCRGGLLTVWDATLAGMGVTPGEVLYFPDSGYNIGNGYDALVLYATEERITLKYTREDNVVEGYTIHVENICVEPSLLDLYRAWNDAGRGRLPALRGGQPLGRARGYEIGVAVRDWGTFLDPRSRKDWWRGK